MQTKSKQLTMAYLENTTTIKPKVGNNTYLCGMKGKNNLSKSDEDYPLVPYNREELLEMVEKGRRQIAEGKYYTTEEVMQHCLTSKPHHKLA